MSSYEPYRLTERDERGWWVYHRWGIACRDTLGQKIAAALMTLAIARNDKIGYEPSSVYYVT